MASRFTSERSRKRRAIKAGVVAMSGITMDAVYKRDNGMCCICGNWVPRTDATIEHLYPLSRGGSHTLRNVGTAHNRCNNVKGNRTLLELDTLGIRNRLRKGIFT